MITRPINSLDDWVREVQYDLMLSLCMKQPLNEKVNAFVETDEFGKFLRDKAIAKLSGTLQKNDGNLRVWSNTIFEEFIMLGNWIRNFTIGFGGTRDLEIDKAINEVQNIILNKGVDKSFVHNALNPSDPFWKEHEDDYQKIKEEECAKAEKEKEELKAKADAEKRESAMRFLKMGLTVEQVAEGSGLSIEEINEIKKKIQ